MKKEIVVEEVVFTPYLVNIIEDEVVVYTNARPTSKQVSVVRKNEVYTIISEKNGYGKLKNGLGWIDLKATQKL